MSRSAPAKAAAGPSLSPTIRPGFLLSNIVAFPPGGSVARAVFVSTFAPAGTRAPEMSVPARATSAAAFPIRAMNSGDGGSS